MSPQSDELSVLGLLGKYSYTNPYDPASVWSLIIALVPETVDPSRYIDAIEHASEAKLNGEAMDPELGDFVRQEIQKVGWSPELSHGDIKDAFSCVRVRQMDAASGNLSWPLQTAWYTGVAYVLKLYRNYYGVHMSLKEFESQEVDVLVDGILKHSSPSKLNRDVNFLILPLLSFYNRLDIMQEWTAKQPLGFVKVLAPCIPLAGTLLRMCYQASCQDWRAVKDIQVHLRPVEDDEKLSITTIYKSSQSSIAFIGDLANAARVLGSICPPTFEVLAQWSFAPSDVQRGIYNSYLKQTAHWNNILNDIALLRKSVFSNLSQKEIDDDMLIGALRSGKYMFLQSQSLGSKEIIVSEAESIVESFKQDGSAGPEFSTVLAALDVVPPGLLTAVKRQFATLNTAHTIFKVDPVVAVHMDALAVVRWALELTPDAYPRVTDLTRIANELSGQDLSGQVKEFCINSSLACGDFSTAYDLCQTLSGSSAWVSYLQVAKFMSPMWDTKPQSVAEKQKHLIIMCLEKCPKTDITTVAHVWETLEGETRHERTLGRGASLGPGPQRVRKRDQLQKLLIGGIGWAIGAPAD